MKFTLFTTSVLALASFASASTVEVRFDNTYDNKNGALTSVACSNGANGIITRFGFTTFGQLPTFPNIGAAQAVAGFNSPNCGSCWNITYQGKSILVTAIDHAGSGFNVAEAALNTLTNGQAEEVGVIDATATQVDASKCGL